jgi:hypothetical protein
MRRVLLALFVLGACTPQRPEQPLPSKVSVRVSNPAGVVETAPLRHAIVWVTKKAGRNAFVTTDDGPLESTTTTFTAPLALPEDSVKASLYPVEPIAFTPIMYVDAYRPRFVVYGDTNENGRFDPGVLGGDGPDSILGVDDKRNTLPTGILDLDGALSRMTLTDTQAFYERNGGVYSAFVWTDQSGFGLQLADPAFVSIVLPESNFAERDLDCARSVTRAVPGNVPGATVHAPTHALVDPSLDPKVVCGTEIVDCESVDFATLPPPSLEEDEIGDKQRFLQCRANTSFEFLMIFERAVECDACLCKTTSSADLYVTTPSAPPPWWPCGTTTPYCKSDAPATDFDFGCRVKTGDGGVDGGGGDAGLDGGG